MTQCYLKHAWRSTHPCLAKHQCCRCATTSARVVYSIYVCTWFTRYCACAVRCACGLAWYASPQFDEPFNFYGTKRYTTQRQTMACCVCMSYVRHELPHLPPVCTHLGAHFGIHLPFAFNTARSLRLAQPVHIMRAGRRHPCHTHIPPNSPPQFSPSAPQPAVLNPVLTPHSSLLGPHSSALSPQPSALNSSLTRLCGVPLSNWCWPSCGFYGQAHHADASALPAAAAASSVSTTADGKAEPGRS